MVKLIDFGKHLRLGNWLFQYAALSYISEITNNELVLPEYFLWNYLKSPPKVSSDPYFDETFIIEHSEYSEDYFNEIIDYFKKNEKCINIALNCYFQSEKWFAQNIDMIKHKLEIKEDIILGIKNKYAGFFSKPTIGIGIRRGDFVGHSCFYQIPETWYKDTLIKQFKNYEDYNVIVFSDDINWCKEFYKNEKFLFSEPNNTHLHIDNFKYYHNNPMEQFILGTLCDNFIGGSSTFTWWQMWYVKNFNNGRVFHCGKNLQGECLSKFKNSFYYPENWILSPLS